MRAEPVVIVFVAEYHVPEDELERKVNEIGAALDLPTDSAERRQLTVCIKDFAYNVLAAVGSHPPVEPPQGDAL
jgi:hypothetical protein